VVIRELTAISVISFWRQEATGTHATARIWQFSYLKRWIVISYDFSCRETPRQVLGVGVLAFWGFSSISPLPNS
jgi:hypothetical protein